MELFAEIMANLELKDEEFQPERSVVLEERLWRTDNNPVGYLYFRLFNEHFTSHSYHWTPIGFLDDIKNWKIGDFKNSSHKKNFLTRAQGLIGHFKVWFGLGKELF